MLLAGIAFLLFFFIIVIAFTKLKVRLIIHHREGNDLIEVKMSIWFGLIHYTYTVPMINWDDEEDSIVMKQELNVDVAETNKKTKQKKKMTVNMLIERYQKVRQLIADIKGFNQIMKRFFSHISITRLEWQSQFGAGDAALTGMLVGGIWSLKGIAIGMISQAVSLQAYPKIDITPNFQQTLIETKLLCMFSFRIGHAMVAAFRTLKYWKGRKQRWQNIQFKA